MAAKTFIVERSAGDTVEVTAERGEQNSNDSRVTFYNGDETVASFINVQAWFEKAKK